MMRNIGMMRSVRAMALGWMLAGCMMACTAAFASESKGVVTLNGLPVPGVTVTATQGTEKVQVVTGPGGGYVFADLADGKWTVTVDMLCFKPMTQEVTVGAGAADGKWELTMLPVAEILAKATAVKVEAGPAVALTTRPAEGAAVKSGSAPEAPRVQDESAKSAAADGFLINGTSSNASTSQYSMAQAFGNTRSSKSLYSYALGVVYDSSALNARPYSITGFDTGKPGYNRVSFTGSFGGPLNIPHFMPHGPNLFIGYRGTRNEDSETLPGLVPTDAQRALATNVQAAALLALYPHANEAGSTQYNYQTAVLNSLHRDAFQIRADKSVTPRNQLFGSLEFSSTRERNVSLFGFVDDTDVIGLTTNVNYQHRFSQRLFEKAGYVFSRQRTRVTPETFAGVNNFSANNGIMGNDQEVSQWGPPTLAFSDGITTLTDAVQAFNRNRTDSGNYQVSLNKPHHNVTLGGDLRREQFNVNTQSDPRGTFTFTGAATGEALGDFLAGTPDTSSIAFGNPDKYLRQTAYDLYITDDWRARPNLTINAGLRYEYGAPVTELKGRLVNLSIAPQFGAVTPVIAYALGGSGLPTSLVRPDRLGIQPRVGVSFRPIAGSTLVLKGGYGIYDDTNVYEATALALAQQSPLSKSLDVSNGTGCALSLANGFQACGTTTADTFAVDPNFRVGYAQTWQLSAQRDLPASLVGTLSYLGIKGTRGVQEYLPNTYPVGGVNPCTGVCPSGYVFRTSNGGSSREAGTAQLRRRLKNGFTASVQYTYSKSIDNDAVIGGQGGAAVGTAATSATSGTATIAQNWRNLRGERGLSNFDQRHVVIGSVQYTSGQGLGGGSLMRGAAGRYLKEWTVVATVNAASGMPETPIYLAATPGTGVTGAIRASVTGANLYAAPIGKHLNAAAYTAPTLGQYGNAGRNSLEGPGQFTLNTSLARTFRVKDKLNLDARIDATNILNHVTFTSWDAIIGGPSGVSGAPYIQNPTFGSPIAANSMRSLQTTLRLRY